MRRLATGAGIVLLFVATLVIAGRILVDGSEQRTIDTADGRAISIGPSWPDRLDACVSDANINILPNCYREPVTRGSFVKQPWSAWSALSFCAVGLLVLADADRSASRRGGWLGGAAIAAGFGGMLFHATLTAWGAGAERVTSYSLFSTVVVIGFLASTERQRRSAGAAGSSVARLLVSLALLVGAVVMLVVSEPFAGDPIGLPLHATWHVLAALFVLSYWRYLCVLDVTPAPERDASSVTLA